MWKFFFAKARVTPSARFIKRQLPRAPCQRTFFIKECNNYKISFIIKRNEQSVCWGGGGGGRRKIKRLGPGPPPLGAYKAVFPFEYLLNLMCPDPSPPQKKKEG